MAAFQREAARIWLAALGRRSQRTRLDWMRFRVVAARWIPAPKILHPHPNERFYAKHPK
jgi:RNA-directed DNA polymerase